MCLGFMVEICMIYFFRLEIFLSRKWLKPYLAVGGGIFKKLLANANWNLSRQLHQSLTNNSESTYYGQSQQLNDEKRVHEKMDTISHSALVGRVKDCEKRIDKLELLPVAEDNVLNHEQRPISQGAVRRQLSNKQFVDAFKYPNNHEVPRRWMAVQFEKAFNSSTSK